ncbi:MAG: AI-2E family transporter [Chloroflexota bacterium]
MGGLFQDGSFQAGLRVSLAVLFVIAALFLVQTAWFVFQALIIAIVLSASLWPWVSRLGGRAWGPRNWRPPRFLTTSLIYLSSFALLGALVWITLVSALPELDRALASYPTQTAFLQEYLQPFRAGDLAGGAARVAEDVAREATQPQNGNGQAGAASPGPAPLAINAGALLVGLFGGVVTLVLVLIFTFFLLLDGDRFAQWALFLLPRERRPRARLVGLAIRDRVSRWILAEALYVSASGVLVFAGAFLLQLPSPWLYGVLGALCAFLPGIGPAISLIPAFVVALSLEAWQPVGVALFGLLVQALDNTVLVPRVFGQAMRLPALAVLLAVLLGTALMGAWGALIATPVAVAVEVLVREELGRGLGDEVV